MQLTSIELRNYRSFVSDTVHVQSGLTVFVGENNAGKSNIIDALRLLSAPLSGRRDIYCEESDIRFGCLEDCEISATFADLTPPQQGRLLSAATDDTLSEARFGLTFGRSATQMALRPTLWAGRFKAAPEPGCHDMVRHVYLPPLRDARRALASGNPTRIYALLQHFLGDRDPDALARSLSRSSEDQILGNVGTAVGLGLDELTAGTRQQRAVLGFNRDERLIEIARDLRFSMSDNGIEPEDLRYSGHGLANLLYIATIAVELEKVDHADLTLFLVEEPEAHLHPQLQASVLCFLEERSKKALKAKEDPLAPAGHIQVLVATHSPNLSAWVSSTSIVFVRSIFPSQSTPASEESKSPTHSELRSPRAESRSIPIAKLGLTEPEKRKIDRYLDVTKAALLFGGRIVLLEGMAETLLLPVMAEHYVLKGNDAALRRFRSAAFIPIDGVDFEPYAKVLLTAVNDCRIADRLVIITDGDGHISRDSDTPSGEQRRQRLNAFAASVGATDNLFVSINAYSLEAALVEAGNEDLMMNTFLSLHKRSEAKWNEAIRDGTEKYAAVQRLFQNTRKGDISHLLADAITPKRDSSAPLFTVPKYLVDAINAVVQ